MGDVIWLWAKIGIALMIFEILTGTFYVLCFGLAAMLVGIIGGILTIGITFEVALFIILSAIILYVFHFKFKSKKKDSSVGQSSECIGRIGKVIEHKDGSPLFIIEFEEALMSSRTWPALSKIKLEVNESVKVVGVVGNQLRVEKVVG